MTTVAEVHAAVKARLTALFSTIPVRYKGDTAPLPDTPADYAYVELLLDGMDIVAFGGGRGGNLQRTTGTIEAQVLGVAGVTTLATGLATAEQIAAVFRGVRITSPDVSFFAAEVFPASGLSEDGNYDNIATVSVDLFFDKSA